MASSVIHMAVANEINKKLKLDNRSMLIGSIAPDIAKHLGESKNKSHFIKDEEDIPVMEDFVSKYYYYLNNPFVLGYYIHLYTDYLWFKYFMTEINFGSFFKNTKGENIPCNKDSFKRLLYDDYTNVNIYIIDKYNLDLSIFYGEVPILENIIKEIPMNNINLIINKTSYIIMRSKTMKTVVFNNSEIDRFIKTSADIILSEIEKLNIFI